MHLNVFDALTLVALVLSVVGITATIILAVSVQRLTQHRAREKRLGKQLREAGFSAKKKPVDVTPGVLYQEYRDYLKEIQKHFDQSKTLDNPQPDLRAREVTKAFLDAATISWSSTEITDRYRTAYYYMLAAASCTWGDSWETAGRYAHFAGHRFRELDAYQYSAEAYCLAADWSEYGKDLKFRERSARRAVACLEQVCEDEKAAAVKAEHLGEKSAGGAFPVWWRKGKLDPASLDMVTLA